MVRNWMIYCSSALIVFGILLSIYGFDQKQSEDTPQNEPAMLIPPLVQKELDKKLNRYKNTILKKCKERAYEAAEYYIDSLVAEELKIQSSDTLKFPAKPIRPSLTEPIKLDDSTTISPIFEKEQ